MMSSRSRATLIGFSAVLMWAVLALLSAASGEVPPFQLAAMTFLIGGSLGLVKFMLVPQAARALKQTWQVWALGVGGLFGYHFVYFSAIRAAPAVEVSLIAYLWPLLIVVLAAVMPGERLKAHHLIGVVMGLAGAILVMTKGGSVGLSGGLRWGHVLAGLCALIWSGYSTLSRRFGAVPSDAVTGFCLVTAALSLVCHLAFETTVWPATSAQWLAILGLGLLPVGAAFYAWDYGVKHGDIMVLGAASYASPVLSTLVLIAAGMADLSLAVAGACLLITAGAMIAAKDMIFGKTRESALAE